MKKLLLLVMLGMILFAFSCSTGSAGSDNTVVKTDPEFTCITDTWVSSVFDLDMSNYWRAQGITHTGRNYYLFSQPAGDTAYSQRFNPESKYFQSWIGIYTVNDKNGEVYGIRDGELDQDAVIRLGIADQTGWLKDFACIPEPRVLLDETVAVTKEMVTIDGEPGWKLSCRLITQADVGDDNLQSGISDLLIVPSSCWNSSIESYRSSRYHARLSPGNPPRTGRNGTGHHGAITSTGTVYRAINKAW